MQRDMDLVREILLAIEQSPDPYLINHPVISGYSNDVVTYHIGLMKEAALIDGNSSHVMGQSMPSYIMIRLTWDGHEFLDNARDNTNWRKTRTTVGQKIGSVSFDVLKQVLAMLAQYEIKQALGIP